MTGNDGQEGGVAETAWLIEETWNGFVHYVHRDFDAGKWVRETASLDALPFAWVPSGSGGATLTRRRTAIPFITKDANEAMGFATRADAEAWLAAQPPWISCTTQYQPREHMWPESPLISRQIPSAIGKESLNE